MVAKIIEFVYVESPKTMREIAEMYLATLNP